MPGRDIVIEERYSARGGADLDASVGGSYASLWRSS
jgi:hypothetical protein